MNLSEHKRTIYFLITIVFFAATVLFAQFSQIMHSNHEVRVYALEKWAGSDNKRQELVAQFTQTCLLAGSAVTNAQMKLKGDLPEPIIKACAEENGFSGLERVIEEADMVLQTAAWPLSMLDA